MLSTKPPAPQQTFLFRLIRFVTHMQVGYLARWVKNPRVFVILFAASAGATALGIMTAAAHFTKLPLLFPPLAASSFILFYTPMSEGACPRTVVLSHTTALLCGLCSLLLLAKFFPESGILNPSVLNWSRLVAIALSMSLISTLMISFKYVHPPAAATGLIASMGFVVNGAQALGFLAAVILLVLEAFLFNRVLGGIPYPFWQHNHKVAQDYPALAGLSGAKKDYWEEMSARIFHRR